ncbi:hypothetical protein PAA8504_03656 [Palleronia abyssalis]|uniref:Uncharacterized protein n=1 Tax=Palleronia abyssalis TaxID=1501240 RepID=A0A2R8C066_9RHOB|nr:hypothetical protein PAA8504_03656 [Palleronia abyssalis]
MMKPIIGAAVICAAAVPLHAQSCGSVRDVLYRGELFTQWMPPGP